MKCTNPIPSLVMALLCWGSAAEAQPTAEVPPICCGESCSADRPCCDGTVCSENGQCVPDVCSTCGSNGCRVNFITCSAECAPPSCCGESCGAARPCCDGTVCSSDGRCVPQQCTQCGDVGCVVDYDVCSAHCAVPECCLSECTTSAQCCAGTVCRERSGVRQCVPRRCDDCTGDMPTCQVDDQCQVACGPPEACGRNCTSDSECGSGLQCYEFSSNSRCVPDDFEDLCRPCGSAGCNFSARDCSVTCNQ